MKYGYTINNKLMANSNGKLLTTLDTNNPLNLPLNTIRVRTNDGEPPNRPYPMYDSATLVSGTTDVYDVYKEGNQLNYEDELSKNNVIEIIQLSSSMYTNIVNINKNLQEATDKNIIRFGVTWTKVTNLGDIESYNKDFSISPLKMGLDGKLEKPNIIIEEDDIIIEYIDGCIRAFTKSRNIKECIISYCYLING